MIQFDNDGGGINQVPPDPTAVITAACAEVLRLRCPSELAGGLLERMRTRFPRHRAFQEELKLAAAKVGRDSS